RYGAFHYLKGRFTPMHYVKPLAIAAAVLVVTAIFAVSASATAHGGAVVKTGPSSLGRVLVDSHGKTLYLWAHDKSSKSTCNSDCTEYWPPLVTRGKPVAQAGANAQLLGTTRRSDGRLQVTYAGHPLYYFIKDTKPGQTNGEALTGFGGRWDPVSAAGAAVRKHGTVADSSAPIAAQVIAPSPGDIAGVGGLFSVDISLQARTRAANALLSGYTSFFHDP